MTIVIDLNQENKIFEKSVIGLGNFDGIHIGHMKIIDKVKEIAKEKKIKSSVLLFKQHTNEVFPNFPRYYISSLEDKIDKLTKLDIDIIYIIDFTLEFAQLDNEQFILEFIRDKLNAFDIVCGKDYTFGKLSLGNMDILLEYKRNNEINPYFIDTVIYNDKKASSTCIRTYIENGSVEKVYDLLGHNYFIKGEVVHGFKIGSTKIGYPTANLKLDFRYILPIQGVYLTYTYFNNEKYLSLTSIGTNPTITDKKDIKIETFILDFNKKIYGEKLKIEFIHKIRNQIKFEKLDDLINQMNKDFEYALNYKKSLK